MGRKTGSGNAASAASGCVLNAGKIASE